MVYSENLEGNPDVNPGEGETARETARFFCGGLIRKMDMREVILGQSSCPITKKILALSHVSNIFKLTFG